MTYGSIAGGITTPLDDDGRELLKELKAVKWRLTHGRPAAASHIITEVNDGRPFLGWQDDARTLLSEPR